MCSEDDHPIQKIGKTGRTRKSKSGELSDKCDQVRDKPLMCLSALYKPVEKQGELLNSFFAQRLIYFAYFGHNISISPNEFENTNRKLEFV
jgi:hypothetical protein